MSQLNKVPTRARHVVITVHGIRTFGQWQERLCDLLRKKEPQIELLIYKYGYYSLLDYLLPPLRWIERKKFRRELERVALHYQDAWVDIVAHSFGTHLVAWELLRMRKENRPTIHTIVLAGSVLKPGFRWGDLMDVGSVHRVVNECGINDKALVIGQVFALFTGMAGRLGFAGMHSDQFMDRYHNGGHSDFFLRSGQPSDDFMSEKWVPLLTTSKPTRRIDERVSKGIRQGIGMVLLQNAEPIKLIVYTCLFLVPFIVYFWLYIQANEARRIATSRELAASSLAELRTDPERSLLLATEASDISDTTEAEGALRQSLLESRVRTVLTPRGKVSRAAFSPDGKLVATATDDGSVQLWELATKREIAQLGKRFAPDPPFFTTFGHTGPVTDVVFSSDGKSIVTTSRDKTVRVWRIDAGDFEAFTLEAFTHDYKVSSFHAGLSANGRFSVRTTGDGELEVSELSTRKTVGRLLHCTDTGRIAVSSDGRFVITASGTMDGEDAILLRLAAQLEKAKPWAGKRPAGF